MLISLAALSAFAATQDHIITSVEAHERFRLTDQQLAAFAEQGVLRRLFFGVYLVDADVFPETPVRSLLRAALKRYGKTAVLWGASAALVHGIEGLVGPHQKPWVMLPLAEPKPRDDRVRLRFREPCESGFTVVDGFPVTIVTRTLADVVPEVDRPTGLSLFDSALHQCLLSAGEAEDVCLLAAGRRGAPRVREIASLGDRRADNPLESRVRLACVDGDVPPDELQWPVRAETGELLGIGDMAWLRRPRRRPLVGEADGEEPHSRLQPLLRDRRRGNDFTGAAVDTVRFTWVDSTRPAYITSTVRRALAA